MTNNMTVIEILNRAADKLDIGFVDWHLTENSCSKDISNELVAMMRLQAAIAKDKPYWFVPGTTEHHVLSIAKKITGDKAS